MAKIKKKNRVINWHTIRDLYVMRKDTPSLSALAREFGLDSGQISRKSTADQWKKRRKIFQSRVTEIVQKKTVKLAALEQTEAIKITVSIVEQVVNAIKVKGHSPFDSLSSLVGSYDKLIRLHQLLQGKSDGSGSESLEELFARLTKIRIKEHKEALAIERPAKQLPVIDAETVDDKQNK